MRNLNPISENSNFDCWRSNVEIISSAYESKEKFTFCIRTQVKNNFTDLQLQLNEEIQRRFQRVCYLKMSSCVNTNTKTSRWDADCHVYSLSDDFLHSIDLNACFQGEKFAQVEHLLMGDQNSFSRQ